MNTSTNKFDAIESLIFNEGLRIEAIDFHPELDVMLVVLNTKAVLHQRISMYANLSKGNIAQLKDYELLSNGTGIHWPQLDEDLSLKGFLQDELRNVAGNNKKAMVA